MHKKVNHIPVISKSTDTYTSKHENVLVTRDFNVGPKDFNLKKLLPQL